MKSRASLLGSRTSITRETARKMGEKRAIPTGKVPTTSIGDPERVLPRPTLGFLAVMAMRYGSVKRGGNGKQRPHEGIFSSIPHKDRRPRCFTSFCVYVPPSPYPCMVLPIHDNGNPARFPAAITFTPILLKRQFSGPGALYDTVPLYTQTKPHGNSRRRGNPHYHHPECQCRMRLGKPTQCHRSHDTQDEHTHARTHHTRTQDRPTHKGQTLSRWAGETAPA